MIVVRTRRRRPRPLSAAFIRGLELAEQGRLARGQAELRQHVSDCLRCAADQPCHAAAGLREVVEEAAVALRPGGAL
jgi:hypothetical protein